jgi:dihydrodipicolinate synthase/N-acetylneuraminate lyase
VMSGSDTRLPEVFSLGGAGCIGGLVNIVPDLMVHLHRVYALRQPGDATGAAALMPELGRIIDQLTFPLNVAAGIEARGLRPGVPKMIVSPESRTLYAKIVAELGQLFQRAALASASPAAA